MPVQQCQADGISGWKWGSSGKCYTGSGAKVKAARQGAAIRASGFVKNRTQIVAGNPLKADPTRTATLRRVFETDLLRRYAILKRKIWQLIAVKDAFGLRSSSLNPFTNREQSDDRRDASQDYSTDSGQSMQTHGGTNRSDERDERQVGQTSRRGNGATGGDSPSNKTDRFTNEENQSNNVRSTAPTSLKHNDTALTSNTRWRFLSSPQKVAEFRLWLETQVQIDIMGRTGGPLDDAYWDKYIQQGYEKGAGRAFDDTRAAKAGFTREEQAFFQGTKDEFLRSSFAQPVAIEKVQLLAGRVFTNLKGVNEAMSSKLSQMLADGLVQGQNPTKIARTMIREGIGFTKTRGIQSRALTIARTEIIRAHAEGQLDSMEKLGVDKVGVMAEWSSAGDDRVCPLCQPLDGVVMTVKEARGILPRHPNCRCAWIPSNVGESAKGQIRGKERIEKAMDKSIRAEMPKIKKRTLAEQKRRTSWGGADKTIAKTRPKSPLEK